MKIRKNHKQKRFRYSVNKKTQNKKHLSTGKIKDPVLKKLYEESKQPATNFKEMGLSANPNKTVSIPSFKQSRLQAVKIVNGFLEEELSDDESKPMKPKYTPNKEKASVAERLEQQSKLRADSHMRLPKGVVNTLTYFLDKYKFDYKAMVADKKNFEQWTWKQFRMKIRKFMSIPEQFNEYLAKQKLAPGANLPWPEYDSDSEWR